MRFEGFRKLGVLLCESSECDRFFVGGLHWGLFFGSSLFWGGQASIRDFNLEFGMAMDAVQRPRVEGLGCRVEGTAYCSNTKCCTRLLQGVATTRASGICRKGEHARKNNRIPIHVDYASM